MKLPDLRNANILININGKLVPRKDAKISVFDSVVQGGDAVWEGLRVYKGKIAALTNHLYTASKFGQSTCIQCYTFIKRYSASNI